MGESLLNEMGWEALANIRLRRLEEVNEENVKLRAALMKIRDVVGTSTEAHHIARHALEQDRE
jgi:hypothetical protein